MRARLVCVSVCALSHLLEAVLVDVLAHVFDLVSGVRCVFGVCCVWSRASLSSADPRQRRAWSVRSQPTTLLTSPFLGRFLS